jgi:hypothetical protein
MSTSAVYVYCVAQLAAVPARMRVPPGLPSAGCPELLELAPRLFAVVADVPLSEYSPERIEGKLRDLDWVADVAVAHEKVVEYFAGRHGATILPMKLFTMFASREKARADLRAQKNILTSALRRVRGCREWGVRIVRARRDGVPARRAENPHAAGAGARFLALKKQLRDDAAAEAREAGEAAERAYRMLVPLSRSSRRRTDVPETATAPPLVDAAFLVPAERTSRFRAAAKRAAAGCRTAGADMTLTGPWPPYNFVRAGNDT